MHSLIQLIPRMRSGKRLYWQARFFHKTGSLIRSISFPEIASRSEAYLYARQLLKEIYTPVTSIEEIEQYGLLTIAEARSIFALKDDNPNDARNALIALLGVTCGLGITEICNLKRNQITQNDMFLIEARDRNRIIPFTGNVKNRLNRLNSYYPECSYVIPNMKNTAKPCNPITITRGLSSVLTKIGIKKERKIVPSVLRETFLTLLASCSLEWTKNKIEMETLDYLCGFYIPDIEISYTKKIQITKAIESLNAVIEDLKFNVINGVNWYN